MFREENFLTAALLEKSRVIVGSKVGQVPFVTEIDLDAQGRVSVNYLGDRRLV